MKEYRIIDYSIEYQQKLKNFLKLHNPSFSDTYIDFLVDNAWNENHEEPAILVVDEEDNIVGEHLFFYTNAKINGTEQKVKWSHDTFLEESARKLIGLDFVLKINNRTDSFGIGLSNTNKKIAKKTKYVYWAPLYTYLLFNPYFILASLKKIIGIVPKCSFIQMEQIEVNNSIFRIATSEKELKIPNEGYWGGDSGYDIEFVRDDAYINKRFFSNPVHQYYFYHLLTDNEYDEAYFVIRPIIYKGMKALCVADFRYNLKESSQLNHIIKAVMKLAHKNSCGIVHMTTSDQTMFQLLKKKRWVRTRSGDFTLSSVHVNKDNYSIMATLADPDGEYHL